MTRLVTRTTILALVTLATSAHVYSLAIEGYELHAGQSWIYNGFTTDDSGNPVQGSDVSPIRFTAGGAVRLKLFPGWELAPGMLLFRQEYLSLDAYDKTVPTQIESGGVLGDVASILTVIASSPFYYVRPIPGTDRFTVSAGASPSLVFRIPLSGIDGSRAGPVAGYFFRQLRFLMPELAVQTDYRFSDRFDIGVTVRWFIPIYNAWDTGEATGFLDENLLYIGTVIRLRQ